MRDEYEQELKDLKAKMLKAEKFAEKLPIFAERILQHKFTGEENALKFGERYKKINLGWGINRYFYKDKANITNYRGECCDKYLFNIYINTRHLFDGNDNFGLYESMKGVEVFWTDTMNSTFYVIDETIEIFLENLNTWYLAACESNGKMIRQKKIDAAKEELRKLGVEAA